MILFSLLGFELKNEKTKAKDTHLRAQVTRKGCSSYSSLLHVTAEGSAKLKFIIIFIDLKVKIEWKRRQYFSR
jgi:hypothetical protein